MWLGICLVPACEIEKNPRKRILEQRDHAQASAAPSLISESCLNNTNTSSLPFSRMLAVSMCASQLKQVLV